MFRPVGSDATVSLCGNWAFKTRNETWISKTWSPCRFALQCGSSVATIHPYLAANIIREGHAMANRATTISISSSVKILFAATLAALSLVAAVALASAAKANASFDGAWRVTIVTQSGNCDPAYSYPVKVEGGRVLYNGDNSFEVSGTVGESGAVSVSIGRGDQHANGSGKLAGNAGSGQWTGKSSSTVCSGRWEATRTS